MNKTCGTCKAWKPPAFRQISFVQCVSEEARCLMLGKLKDAEAKPESWCWMQASPEQLASRVKAGIIKAEEVGLNCASS